ncbi:MAG: hypothetical protein WD294_15155, partial [Phycisphaeraceae bacterium]
AAIVIYNTPVPSPISQPIPGHDPFAHLTRLQPIRGETEDWRLNVPAKPATYLLEDAEHRPILLATVGNLRQALLRRLSEPTEEGGKRIDYRALVRFVRWRDVCSRFEGDWAYLCNARRLFNDQWQKMTRNWRGWWIGCNLDEAHPRFVARDHPFTPTDQCFGPLPERRLARQCIEALEDAFDLCREHHLLTQTPNAVACAYKQMAKCPAPCDGTITMHAYRDQLRQAAAFLAGDRQPRVQQITQAIKAASAELNFELAATLKAQLDHVEHFASPSMAHFAPASAFNYVVLQSGRRKHCVRAFVVTPARIHFAGEMQKRQRAQQMAYLVDLADHYFEADASAELAPAEVGLVAWHMQSARRAGAFLHCPEGHVDQSTLATAIASVGDPDASSPP